MNNQMNDYDFTKYDVEKIQEIITSAYKELEKRHDKEVKDYGERLASILREGVGKYEVSILVEDDDCCKYHQAIELGDILFVEQEEFHI